MELSPGRVFQVEGAEDTKHGLMIREEWFGRLQKEKGGGGRED